MNERVTNDSFEDALRLALAPPSIVPAPLSLRSRVLDVPEGRTHGFGGLRPALQLAAVVLFAVVVIGLLSSVGISSVHPAATAPPVATTPQFDPSVDGVGMVVESERTLREVPWAIAILISGSALVLSLGRGRRWKAVVVGGSIGLVGAAFVISTQPGPVFGNAWGAPRGIEIEYAPSVTHGPDAFHVVAEPGENFMVTFNITNDGILPATILGVISGPPDDARYHLLWTALGVDTDTHGGFEGIDNARPFEPFVLNPGEYASFYLAGRAGPCAVGRTGETDGSGAALAPVSVAYAIFGLPAASDIRAPFVVAEAQRNGCPSEPATQMEYPASQ